MQIVVVRSEELLARAVYFRCPVHRFLGYVYWARKCLGASGSEQDTIPGLAASVHGGPAVDFRDVGVRDDLERYERQHAACDNSLDNVRDNGPSNEEGG